MGSHVIMKKSLAKALMDAGVEHFDAGGIAAAPPGYRASAGTGSTTAGGLGGAVSGFFGGQNQFHADAPTIETQEFTPQITEAKTRNNQIYNAQNSLARALLLRSQGQGPNPALSQLNTATGNNVAATAALMAGAKGANRNAGLIAQEAARQGAATQQQAVGQGATLQAQQELAAQNELEQLYGAQAGTAMQEQGILEGALAAQNSAETTGQLGAEETNAQVATANANNASSAGGGILGGIGSILGKIFYKGGRVQHFADGGMATYATPIDPHVVLNVKTNDDEKKGFQGLGDSIADKLSSKSTFSDPSVPGLSLGVDTTPPTPSSVGIPGVVGAVPSIPELMPTGGGPGLVAPQLPGLARGGVAPRGTGAGYGGVHDNIVDLILASGAKPQDYRDGGSVVADGPEQEAVVKGDSPKNDLIPSVLSEDEAVLPRSVTMAPDAPERAKKFVEQLQKEKGTGAGYGGVLKAKASLKERVDRLEKLCMGGRV